MIRVTRDGTKLGSNLFIRFWVSYPSEGKPLGAYSGPYSLYDPEKRSDGIKISPLPIEQVFEEARWFAKSFAKSNDIPVILIIDDPKQQFDVEPWVRQGLINYFDDHS
jgi:hypothetical protein